MSTDLLIEQALAVMAAAGPITTVGMRIEITPAQSLVHCIYAEVQAAARGYGKESNVARYSRDAVRAGIPQAEVDAAVARAHYDLAR